MKITVSSNEFQTFIRALNLVDYGGASLSIYKDHIETFVLPLDNMLVLYAKINILNPDDIELPKGENNITINIGDLSKFQRLLDNNNSDTFTFKIDNNYIVYEGGFIKKAKFILNENPPKSKSKRLTLESFENFKKTFYNCNINKDVIKKIIQLAYFTGLQDVKVYFSTQNDELTAELDDKSRSNVDNISVKLADRSTDNFVGDINECIIPLVALTKLSLGSDKVLFEASKIACGDNDKEVIFVTVNSDNLLLKYMLNCKTA